MEIITEKRCTWCQKTKPISSFKTKGPKRLRSECRDCTNKYRKYKRIKHKELVFDISKILSVQKKEYEKYIKSLSVKIKIPKRIQRKIWDKNNPEKRREIKKNSKYRRRGNTVGSFSEVEWLELCSKYGNKCLCCGEKKPLTRDHVIPLTDGGLNIIDNIQPLCKTCNSRKGTKTIDFRGKVIDS